MNDTTETPKEEAAGSMNEEYTSDPSTRPGTSKVSLKDLQLNRLKVFLQTFVNQFEKKLTSYCEEVTPGNNQPKAGKTTEVISQVVEAVSLPAPRGVSVTPLTSPIKYIGERNHRDKAKIIVEVFRYKENRKCCLEKGEIRRMLIEAGCAIFKNFVSQFIVTPANNEDWARWMEKLAVDATDRAINYINGHKKENPNRNIEASVDLITKGVILGKSKDSTVALCTRWIQNIPSQITQKKDRSKEWETSELYEKTGIKVKVKDEDEVIKYYKKKGSNTKKYGYRDTFHWEIQEQELQNKYKIVKDPCLPEFINNKYTLMSEDEINEQSEIILREINKNDPHIQLSKAGFQGTSKVIKKEAIKFNINDPVKLFTGREKELNELHNKLQCNSKNRTVISQMTCITGLGGIGKSELARQYACKCWNEYDDNIIWIRADSHSTLENSFFALAKDPRVNILRKDKDGEEKTIETLVKEIYIFFADKKSLFIFDNAEKYRSSEDTGIDRFLPLSSLTSKSRFLITSRNREWREIDVIELDTLTEEEAAEFIRRSLKQKLQDVDIKKISEKLQSFPLALQQAMAYINERDAEQNNIGLKFDISDYLKSYEEETKTLLNFEFPDDSSNLYTKTTLTTWKITVDKIKENKEYGEQAGQILEIIAYFAPDSIPVQMFLGSELIGDDKLGGAVKLLKKYSMVNSGQEQTLLNIHRLVQQVTRIHLKDQNMEENIIKKAFNLLGENFRDTSFEPGDYTTNRQLLPQLEAFLSHVDNLVAKKPQDKLKIELEYVMRLLFWIEYAYLVLGNPRKREEVLERIFIINEYICNRFVEGTMLSNLQPQKKEEALKTAFQIKELVVTHLKGNISCCDSDNLQEQKKLLEGILINFEKYYPNHCDTYICVILVNLAGIYCKLGDPQKSKELLEQSLQIVENRFGPEHFSVGKIVMNLSIVYGYLGDTQKEKELLEQSLKILENCSPDHYIVTTVLLNLSRVYENLGDRQKAKELLERSLKFLENHYPEHVFIASVLINLGRVYGDFGDLQKQKELQERALEIQEKNFGLDHFEVADTLKLLCIVYFNLGDQQKQKEVLERALKIEEKYYGSYNFKVFITLTLLCMVYGISGERQKQKDSHDRALKILEKYSADHFDCFETMVNLGIVYGVLRDPRKQTELLDRAYKTNFSSLFSSQRVGPKVIF